MNIDAQKTFGTRECPACGSDVPANNNRCPICRYEFPVPTPAQRFVRIGGAIIMLAILLWFLVLSLR
jgi:predicted amidophosphoribosyltransferase